MAGRCFFTSFDEAWSYFIHREEPLEDFFESFPEHDSYVLGWAILVDRSIEPPAADVQAAFAHLDWLVQPPDDFLHVWIGGVALTDAALTRADVAGVVARAQDLWAELRPFEVLYRRVNCFHSAVVVEVEGHGPHELLGRLVDGEYWSGLKVDEAVPGALDAVRMETFLPHASVGFMRGANDAEPLRRALVPIRDTRVGAQLVSQVSLCLLPASRATILSSLAVVGSVTL